MAPWLATIIRISRRTFHRHRNGSAGVCCDVVPGVQKTYKVFGERNVAHYGSPAAAQFAYEFDVFRYRNINYFDTFLDQGYDFARGPLYTWSKNDIRRLRCF